MTQTGDVSARGSINSRDIITGLKIDNLTVVYNAIDDLSRYTQKSGTRHRRRSDGGLDLVSDEKVIFSLPPDLIDAFKLLPRASDRPAEERRRTYAAWLVTRQPLSPPQRVAARERYVQVGGHTSWDWEDDPLQLQLSWLRPTGEGPERRIEREKLPDVTSAVQRFPAFVLLGPPGCGKSTVLERLAYTTARDYLHGGGRRLPLWLTLASYHWERQLPLEFVQSNLTARVADDFVDLARSGRILLLVDGLNEMPRLAHADERSHRAGDWKRFVEEHFAEDSPAGSRSVIASRDAQDYEQRLGLPRVEIDPLNSAQIEQFVKLHLAGDTEAFLNALDRLDLLKQATNPFALFILTRLYDPSRRDIPANRGLMFAHYASGLLSVMYPHQDIELQAALQALAELGYTLQEQGEATVLPADDLRAMLPDRVQLSKKSDPTDITPSIIFDNAWRAGLLSQVDQEADAYRFSHQLLQEQFAARHLVRRWQEGNDMSSLWLTPRSATDMPDPEAGEWDPLPLPPASGWEQTTILATGMTTRPDEFVNAVLAASPALAGRCLSEGGSKVAAETRAAVQQALLADLRNETLHRRTRIQSGQVLAVVDDPRFEPIKINETELVMPDLIEIPGGTATLGSDNAEAYGDEQPVHQVEVARFYLARYPVANAEYRCFINAGGYDTERFWTPTGWQWRHGEADTSGPVEEIMVIYRYLREEPDRIDQLVKEGRLIPDRADQWRQLAELPAEEAEQLASRSYPLKPHERPGFWDDPAYNSANQPVVGVTWYEAMAYCAWLNEQIAALGQEMGASDDADAIRVQEIVDLLTSDQWRLRLPTEAEWEWAAGGSKHPPYPWGSGFDVDRANTLEGRILGTSPVGIYPAGTAECGALDLSGNVNEWTHSLYQDYPYQSGDGCEDPLAEGRRTVRGGSWYGYQRNARVSSRTGLSPDTFVSLIGFRVVVAPVLK